MSGVSFEKVTKVYDNGFVAVKDLDLEVNDGELLVVVGPSGCGKTTTLRMLAGLEDITAGEVKINDQVVNNIQARNRNIAMVFQSYALYPHLTVAGNLEYPLRLAKMPKHERKERVLAVARQLHMEELLDRKPRQLSGGQRQRVAMGRAMVRKPAVFLMDEPLSNLDAKLRVLMRAEVAELQADLGATMFYVTHDQVEAMTMGDRVAVMDKGVLQQVAEPTVLYREPANLFVASFIGSPPMNLANGILAKNDDGSVAFTSGSLTTTFSAAMVDERPRLAEKLDQPIVLGIRPEHITLTEPNGSIRATVKLVEMLGSETLVHIEVDGIDTYQGDTDPEHQDAAASGRWLVKVHEPISMKPGTPIGLELRTNALHVFDAPNT